MKSEVLVMKKVYFFLICFLIIFFSNACNSNAAFPERPVLFLVAAEESSQDFELFRTEVKRRFFFPNYKVLPQADFISPLKAKAPLSKELLTRISEKVNCEIIVFLNIHKYEQYTTYMPFNSDDDYVFTNIKLEVYLYDKTNNIFIYHPYKEQNIEYILSVDKKSDLVREELRTVLSNYLTQMKELK